MNQARNLVSRPGHLWAFALVAAGSFIVIALLSLTHAAALGTVAKTLAWAGGQEDVRKFIASLPGDDIHSLLALGMMSDLHSPRIALDIPGGDFLVGVFPDLFTPSSGVDMKMWVSAVYSPGSSAVGMHIADLITGILEIFLGLLIAVLSAVRAVAERVKRLHIRSEALIILGILYQAAGVASVFRLSWTAESGGEILLNMISTKVLWLDGATYNSLTFLAEPLLSPLLNGIIVIGIYVLVLGLAIGAERLARIRVFSPYGDVHPWLAQRVVAVHLLPAPLSLALGLLLLQPQALIMDPGPPQPIPSDVLWSLVNDRQSSSTDDRLVKGRPSTVSIAPVASRFEYRVDGKKKRIRGVGYNAMTTGMSLEERRQRYAADFRMMRAARINTIVGWDPAEFDEVLLNAAADVNLGVILPLYLSPTSQYEDPTVRAQLLQDIRAWTERYKSYPALRMWGLGNEVLHGIGSARSTRAVAFARFLVEAADLVHELDPNHPVVYRGAEDVFLEPIAKALNDGKSRPWFVYGMNFFSYRMAQALSSGPAVQLSQPLMLSEFAPAGMNPPFRSAGYSKQWEIIQNFSQKVIGGCAYVWSTVGPEPLDRSFGLTDGRGHPVDDSLATLASLYLSERALEEASSPGHRVRIQLE